MQRAAVLNPATFVVAVALFWAVLLAGVVPSAAQPGGSGAPILSWAPKKVQGVPPQKRMAHVMARVGNTAYVHGGWDGSRVFDDVFALDLDAWTWQRVKTTGVGPGKRLWHAAATVDTSVWVFGGWDSTGSTHFGDVYELDTQRNKWFNHTAAMTGSGPGVRSRHRVAAVGTAVYLFGGYDDSGKFHNDLFRFDTTTLTWSKPALYGTKPAARALHAFARVGGTSELVLFGGGDAHRDIEGLSVMDVEFGAWSAFELAAPSGDAPSARSATACTPVGSHSVAIFGGFHDEKRMDELWVLDAEAAEWRRVRTSGKRPKPRLFGDMVAHGPLLVLFGGGGDRGVTFNDVHVLDLAPLGLAYGNGDEYEAAGAATALPHKMPKALPSPSPSPALSTTKKKKRPRSAAQNPVALRVCQEEKAACVEELAQVKTGVRVAQQVSDVLARMMGEAAEESDDQVCVSLDEMHGWMNAMLALDGVEGTEARVVEGGAAVAEEGELRDLEDRLARVEGERKDALKQVRELEAQVTMQADKLKEGKSDRTLMDMVMRTLEKEVDDIKAENAELRDKLNKWMRRDADFREQQGVSKEELETLKRKVLFGEGGEGAEGEEEEEEEKLVCPPVPECEPCAALPACEACPVCPSGDVECDDCVECAACECPGPQCDLNCADFAAECSDYVERAACECPVCAAGETDAAFRAFADEVRDIVATQLAAVPTPAPAPAAAVTPEAGGADVHADVAAIREGMEDIRPLLYKVHNVLNAEARTAKKVAEATHSTLAEHAELLGALGEHMGNVEEWMSAVPVAGGGGGGGGGVSGAVAPGGDPTPALDALRGEVSDAGTALRALRASVETALKRAEESAARPSQSAAATVTAAVDGSFVDSVLKQIRRSERLMVSVVVVALLLSLVNAVKSMGPAIPSTVMLAGIIAVASVFLAGE